MVKSEFMKCPDKEAETYTDMSNFTVNPVDKVTLLHLLHHCHHYHFYSLLPPPLLRLLLLVWVASLSKYSSLLKTVSRVGDNPNSQETHNNKTNVLTSSAAVVFQASIAP